jgi:hypothetical protein
MFAYNTKIININSFTIKKDETRSDGNTQFHQNIIFIRLSNVIVLLQ